MVSGKKKTENDLEPELSALNVLNDDGTVKKRERVPCLKCGKQFWSVDKTRNRICKVCSGFNARQGGETYHDPKFSTQNIPSDIKWDEGE